MSSPWGVEVDARALLQALDDLGEFAEAYCDRASHETALAIQFEARRRVARRTGRTATGITVERSHNGQAWIVSPFNEAHRLALTEAGNENQARNLPHWLEFGTRKMTARPYLFVSAWLEKDPHLRRIAEALQDAAHDAVR